MMPCRRRRFRPSTGRCDPSRTLTSIRTGREQHFPELPVTIFVPTFLGVADKAQNLDFIAMMSKEVPTATFILSPARRTNRAGIIKKPPPAPTNPVSIPTPIRLQRVDQYVLWCCFSFTPIIVELTRSTISPDPIEIDVATIKPANKRRRPVPFVRLKLTMPNSTGIARHYPSSSGITATPSKEHRIVDAVFRSTPAKGFLGR